MMRKFQDQIDTPYGEVYHLTGDKELAAKAQAEFRLGLKIQQVTNNG